MPDARRAQLSGAWFVKFAEKMKREEDQQLWDLLGQTTQRQLSPFFARNVVRRIREQPPDRFERLRSWLTPRKLVPVTGLVVAVIAVILAAHQPATRNQADSAPDVIAAIDPQDYDVVADLDELLVTDESSLWDEDTQTL
ncbi:MAG: hypothetical protein DMF45_08255 [Verrucomicrobia bacterium]|nr:MAG: hypothetical protein DMF45_08255 [Verrucomicrobiota bacterium]